MSNSDPVQIPLSVDTHSLSEAIHQAEELDDILKQAKQSASALFTHAPGFGKNATPASWQTVQQAASLLPPTQLASAYSPQFAQSWQDVQQRRKMIEESFRLFAASPQFKAGTPAQMAQAFQTYANTSNTGAGGGARGAGGNQQPVPITMPNDLVQALGRALSTSSLPAAISAVRGALSGHPFQALSGAAYAARAGGVTGMVGLGAGLAGAAVGAGVAVGGFVGENQAQYQRRQALLTASLYNESSQTSSALGSGLVNAVNDLGQSFNIHPGDAQRIAVQAAMAGVAAPQLGGGISNTFAMGRLSGLGPEAISPLTNALMVQGGQSPEQVSKTFQLLIEQSNSLHIPMNKMVQDLKDLIRETGNASVSITGMTAVQKLIGPSLAGGQLLAPAMGATGMAAEAAAAALHVTPQQFFAMQSNPAKMFDAMSGMVRRVDKGGTQGAFVAEQMLQSLGLMDFTGQSPQQVMKMIELMRTRPPGAAQKLAAMLPTGTKGMNAWLGQTAQDTTGQTGQVERLAIAVSNAVTNFLNPSPPAGSGHWVNTYHGRPIWVPDHSTPPGTPRPGHPGAPGHQGQHPSPTPGPSGHWVNTYHGRPIWVPTPPPTGIGTGAGAAASELTITIEGTLSGTDSAGNPIKGTIKRQTITHTPNAKRTPIGHTGWMPR